MKTKFLYFFTKVRDGPPEGLLGCDVTLVFSFSRIFCRVLQGSYAQLTG